jgi:hypothetical protein
MGSPIEKNSDLADYLWDTANKFEQIDILLEYFFEVSLCFLSEDDARVTRASNINNRYIHKSSSVNK